MRYDTRDNSRCTGVEGFFDCSGLQCYAGNHVGLNYGCNNSFTMSSWCHYATRPQWMIDLFGPGRGTQITRDQAVRTKGAWKFHGYNEGMSGAGPSGHIAVSYGDGRSIEAYSHSRGVIIGTFIDSKTTYYALPPGLTGFDQDPGSNPGPSNTQEARDMGFVAKVVPGAKMQTKGPFKGRIPFVAAKLHDQNWDIVGFNGAQIPGGKAYLGMSVLSIGHLNAPISDADIPNQWVGNIFKPARSIIFLAEDGGTFGPYKPTIKYG